ncbi:hypothetical protein RRG08_058408 [Elysia crispata]|uniref:BPTI/Kunitz inhibitor domain-containing protein n=1 Tax=Elysia crispata TaxID=231223 RepID=A0AAE0XWA5_9GAST|nr:hypothetical protein RRG08_058408 [Elysia crispata]
MGLSRQLVVIMVIALTVESCLGRLGDSSFTEVQVFQRPSECSEPPETGYCRAHFRRFYYNESSGRCRRFVYGGCGGNNNNFLSARECRHHCTLFRT